MGTYYPNSYNRLNNGQALKKGAAVEIIEVDYTDPNGPDAVTVLHVGTIESFDNRKSSDGYTVLVRTADGLMSARPDELRAR